MKTPSAATRRSFFLKAGAALSVPLAIPAAAVSQTHPGDDVDSLRHRLARLEDENAIRELHRSYARHLNGQRFEELVGLFANESEVRLGGRSFLGRDAGIRALYVGHSESADGIRNEPVQRSLLDHPRPEDSIEVAPDRRSARARFSARVQIEAALLSTLPLVEMARQQGQGTLTWWELGVFENDYVRDGTGWKISRLRYLALASDCEPPAVPG